MAARSYRIQRPNWVYIALRWLMIIGFSAMILVLEARSITSLDDISDILLAVLAGAVATAVLGAILLIRSLAVYSPLIATPGDWLITAVFVYVSQGEPLVILVVAGLLMMSGILRYGPAWGAFHAIGILLAALAAKIAIGVAGGDPLTVDYIVDVGLTNLPVLIGLALLALVTGTWSHTLDLSNRRSSRQMRDAVEENKARMRVMVQRANAVAEMGAVLIESLNYDRVLDAAMDIGRLCVRADLSNRVASLVLLVEGDEDLFIASARGINHNETHRTFRGMRGIIAEALETGDPVIGGAGKSDPELSRLASFSQIKSILCIPLRAHYDNYGVLLFASTEPDAFFEDLIDTLRAVGIQVTLAIQNAVLFSTLLQEKERIIEIEENGRKALARDLHDVPTQTISRVAMDLSLLPKIAERAPEQLISEIEKIRQMALRATAEIRHVMFTLRPLALETQGLNEALRQLVEKTKSTFNQRIDMDIDENALLQLNDKQESALFYLVEEAVNNARKYAKASLIKLRVSLEGSLVIVRVVDNGVGFDPTKVSHKDRDHLGMVNMRDRAQGINASFDIESRPGMGTTITVSVPVDVIKIPAAAVPSDDRPDTKTRRSFQARRPEREYNGPLSPST